LNNANESVVISVVTKFIVLSNEKLVITNYKSSQEEIKEKRKCYEQMKVFQSSIIRTDEKLGVIHPKLKNNLLMELQVLWHVNNISIVFLVCLQL